MPKWVAESGHQIPLPESRARGKCWEAGFETQALELGLRDSKLGIEQGLRLQCWEFSSVHRRAAGVSISSKTQILIKMPKLPLT